MTDPEPSSPTRNLPALVPAPAPASGNGDGLFGRWLRALFGWRGSPTRADLETVLEAAVHGEAGVSPAELTMLKNILALRGRRIEDVMVPRADIVAVQQDIPLGELIKVFEKAGHSRLVVYNDTLDDPVGMVHIRDLIAFMAGRASVGAKTPAARKRALPAGFDFKSIDLRLELQRVDIVRTLLFVPPSMPALDLLAKMQATHIHLALVVDEYGGTDGLVSMEDIVEQIVGDISDEHDDDETPQVWRQADGSFVVDARASLEDVVEAVGAPFDVEEEAKEVDTIGGYLMAKGGRLPLRGELIAGPPGYELEVLDADPRRIKRVRIHRRKERAPARGIERRRETLDATAIPQPPQAPQQAPPEPVQMELVPPEPPKPDAPRLETSSPETPPGDAERTDPKPAGSS